MGADQHAPVPLLTKEQLKAQANEKKEHVASDETPIGIQMPDDQISQDTEKIK